MQTRIVIETFLMKVDTPKRLLFAGDLREFCNIAPADVASCNQETFRSWMGAMFAHRQRSLRFRRLSWIKGHELEDFRRKCSVVSELFDYLYRAGLVSSSTAREFGIEP